MIVATFFILAGTKDLSLPGAAAVLILLGLSYLILPAALIRFYRDRSVRRTLELRDTGTYRIETLPMPILVLGALYMFYAVSLHLLLFFKGMFPVFGVRCS